jgi:hypothetical protein
MPGWRLEDITPLDRLLAMGHAGMGALVFEPATPSGPHAGDTGPVSFDLGAVAAQTARILEGIEAVMLTGGSPGGARLRAVRKPCRYLSLTRPLTGAVLRALGARRPDDRW